MTIIAATDGSSLGNPGPAGWAWYIDQDNWRAGALKESTNNVGELLAVLDLLKETRTVDDDLLIYADSQYVINALTKWRFNWKKKGWKKADGKPVANRDIIETLDQELNDRQRSGRRVKFEWVRGHADHEMNEKADDYARGASEAIRDGREINTGPGFAARTAGGQELANATAEEVRSAGDGDATAQSDDPAPASEPSLFEDEPSLFSINEDEAEQPATNSNQASAGRPATTSRHNARQASDDVQGVTDSNQAQSGRPATKNSKGTTTNPTVDAERATNADPVKQYEVPAPPSEIDHTRTTYLQHGVHVTEHRVRVPLDYDDPNGPQIDLFAREITLDSNGPSLDQPAIIFMQGGPGGRAPRPGNFKDGWIGEALKTHRVILMDERGTGLSTRLDALTLSEFDTVDDQANYIKHFRADSMVEDAERLRAIINGGKPWASLGQSYGGFINTTYLSRHPEGLSQVYFTGGLPGLVSVDEIYRHTYRATAARNQVYFDRYPADRVMLRDVLKHLDTHEEILPTGERLSPRRLRMLGMLLGSTTGFDQLHYFFEGPFVTVRGEKRLNTQFLDMVARQVSMGDSPMYALLHETIYAGATPTLKGQPTSWAASRLLDEVGSGVSEGFAPEPDYNSDDPIYLTGEHIYPFIFDEDPALRPMRELAHKLAEFTDWDPVYYPQQLSENEVPGAAAVYFEDMFVPTPLSLATAELASIRPWVTNEYQHDGLRADGARVFKYLVDLAAE